MSEADFEKAALDSKKLTSKPDVSKLLSLYALYKVAKGEDITQTPEPTMFDLKGKTKRTEWQKVVNEGVTVEDARLRYVELVNELKTTCGYDEEKEPEDVGAGT